MYVIFYIEMETIMSFKEKSTFAMFGITIAAVIFYAINMTRLAAEFGLNGVPIIAVFGVMVGAIFYFVILTVLVHIVLAIWSRKVDGAHFDRTDERDIVVERQGDQFASWILTAGSLGALTLVLLQLSPFLVANVLLAGLFGAELFKMAVMIRAYRRGGA
jgi:hypothetical protein